MGVPCINNGSVTKLSPSEQAAAREELAYQENPVQNELETIPAKAAAKAAPSLAKSVAVEGAKLVGGAAAFIGIQAFVLPLVIPEASAAPSPKGTLSGPVTTTSGPLTKTSGIDFDSGTQMPVTPKPSPGNTTSGTNKNYGPSPVGGTGDTGTSKGNVTNPGSTTGMDGCTYLSQNGKISSGQVAICQQCETSLQLTSIDAGQLSYTQAQALLSCLANNQATTGNASQSTYNNSPTGAEQSAMASGASNGTSPCADPALSAPVATACTQCYTAGMDSNTLIACVKQNLATTSGATTGAVGTLKQYAVPIAVGAVILGIVGVAIYSGGKHTGKKPLPKPVVNPPKEPETDKKAPRRYSKY